MSSGIYGIHNLINDKWYVGQSVNIRTRWNAHRSLLARNEKESIHLLRAWNKYGPDAFEWVILEKCSPEELDDREIFWIKQKDSYRNGYNRTVGGGGTHGYKLTEAHKRKIGERTTEKWADSEHREKRLAAMHATMSTDEYKEKLSIAGKKNWENPAFKRLSLERMHEGAITPEARKKRSDSAKKALSNPETKAKISKASKRNWCSKEYREKLAEKRQEYMNEDYRKRASIQSKERWHNDAYRDLVKTNTSIGMRKSARAIIQVETGKIYSCIAEASEELNISSSHISSACLAKRKTAGTYHWRYADETQEDWDKRRAQFLLESGKHEFPSVVCIETGVVFSQPKDAAASVGVDPSNITKVCSGVQLTAGGLRWRYLNETEEQKKKREALLYESQNKDLGASSRKPIICVETNQQYKSVKEAADTLQINRSGISNALRGKSKTAGGFHWVYAT